MPKWPKSVPVLEASDIHRGWFDGPNGTHCLQGWIKAVFPYGKDGSGYSTRMRVVHALMKAGNVRYEGNLTGFNDTSPKAVVAQVWNEAMRTLGYTEVVDA